MEFKSINFCLLARTPFVTPTDCGLKVSFLQVVLAAVLLLALHSWNDWTVEGIGMNQSLLLSRVRLAHSQPPRRCRFHEASHQEVLSCKRMPGAWAACGISTTASPGSFAVNKSRLRMVGNSMPSSLFSPCHTVTWWPWPQGGITGLSTGLSLFHGLWLWPVLATEICYSLRQYTMPATGLEIRVPCIQLVFSICLFKLLKRQRWRLN
jgi:hypothetical protein